MRIAQREYLEKVCQKYNKAQFRKFCSKRAKERFLDPIGLSMYRRPHPDFSRNTKRLSGVEEIALFECLHYIKYHTHKSLINGQYRINQWAALFFAVRNRALSANIGLIHKCLVKTKLDEKYDDLLGLAHESLVRATEGFDPWRGWRFSTYACTSIKRSFGRREPRAVAIESGVDPMYEHDWRNIEDENHSLRVERLNLMLQNNYVGMSHNERVIINRRFCFGGPKATLLELGNELKLSKERIRQIQTDAIRKLKIGLACEPILQ